MRIFFLDQSGHLGGAELCLLDIAAHYCDRCCVGLLADGPFRQRLMDQGIAAEVLTEQAIGVRKESNLRQGLLSIKQLLPVVWRVAQRSRPYDLIYANTQKALVIGALASLINQRPLVYHLHDILSPDHFSTVNRRIAVTLANQFAVLVIANSEATKAAFLAAGGRSDRVHVVYNGFTPDLYLDHSSDRQFLRQQLGLSDDHFVVGHFSRLSPWKGQHVFLEALKRCPDRIVGLLVGDALFGEQDYVQQLHQQVQRDRLNHRVQFLGFRSDIPQLMQACDLIVHSSTAPEPFGRVIVEAMLADRPVVATALGGAIELIESEQTGWLVPPHQPQRLAEILIHCYQHPDQATTIAHQGQISARQRFQNTEINQQIDRLLQTVDFTRV